MLQLWPERPPGLELHAGKWQGKYINSVVVAAVKSCSCQGKACRQDHRDYTRFGLTSILFVQQQVLEGLKGIIEIPSKEIHLVTAAGAPMPVLQYVSVSMQLGDFKSTLQFLVVEDLIMSIILGIWTFSSHITSITIDFASSPVTIIPQPSSHPGEPTVISSPSSFSNGIRSHRDNAGCCTILSNIW